MAGEKQPQPQKRQRKQPVLPEGFLTTTQATKELGVSAATLRRWVKEGRVEAMKVGKQLRFRRTDLRRVVTLPSQTTEAVVAPAPEAEVRRCEQVLDRLLRAQGLKLDRAETEIAAELGRMKTEHDSLSARLLCKVLLLGVISTASDIHIEPFEKAAKVRQRVDGLLTEVMDVPKSVYVRLVAELKRWSNLDVADKFRPQDGRVIVNLGDRDIDLRLSTMPGVFGEIVALRLLDRTAQLVPLDRQGFEADQLDRWRRILHSPNGLILVTAPAGCGKTTLIYTSLMELANPGVKIMTAEEPVEYHLSGVSQSQINPDVGFDYLTAARHMMRQAPNVMFIGEIRNRETAQTLCAAAMTGHLVFSTMHTNDAVLCLRRLIEMGIEPNLVASSVIAVAAQRLVRTICAQCKEEYRPTERETVALQIPQEKIDRKFYVGRGCERCRNTGYRGRVAVIELLEMTGKVREGLVRGDDNLRLIEAARLSGFRLMTELVMEKISRGETTVHEAVRQGLWARSPA